MAMLVIINDRRATPPEEKVTEACAEDDSEKEIRVKGHGN